LTLAIALLAGSPAIASPSTPCSAHGLPPLKPQPGLTAAQQKMRLAIGQAALRCDYAALERLAKPGRRAFLYDWEHQGHPAAFWKQQEKQGKPILQTMIALLTLPPTKRPIYDESHRGSSWVFLTTHPRAARDAFTTFKVVPDYHLTILADGDWTEMVIGD
jgi:hypothetical protein